MEQTAMKQFVPMSDAVLFGEAELPGPLVPYQLGIPCHHALERAETSSREHEAGTSDEARKYRPA